MIQHFNIIFGYWIDEAEYQIGLILRNTTFSQFSLDVVYTNLCKLVYCTQDIRTLVLNAKRR